MLAQISDGGRKWTVDEPSRSPFPRLLFPLLYRYTEGMTSSCSVDIHFGRGEMVILGTQYAGEMKKGVLTLMM